MKFGLERDWGTNIRWGCFFGLTDSLPQRELEQNPLKFGSRPWIRLAWV